MMSFVFYLHNYELIPEMVSLVFNPCTYNPVLCVIFAVISAGEWVMRDDVCLLAQPEDGAGGQGESQGEEVVGRRVTSTAWF